MNRLVMFSIFIVGLAIVLSLKSYDSLPIDNSQFDFQKAKEAHISFQKEMKELEQMRMSRHNPEPEGEEEEVVEDKPLVVLDSPQLERGHDLYQKCLVCHGKRGEGKASQNAPKVGGQHAWYVEKQLVDMKAGRRVNKKMEPYLKPLNTQDMKDLAVYISKLPKDWSE